MKNLDQLFSEYGITIEDDKKEAFLKEFAGNYKTVAELEKKNQQLNDLKNSSAALEETINNLNSQVAGYAGSDDTIKQLQEQLNAYKQAEKEREEAEKQARYDALITENIMTAVGERQFANDFVKDSVLAKIKEALGKNSALTAKEALENITKDIDGVWVNPQQQQLKDNPAISESAQAANGSNVKAATDDYISNILHLDTKDK